MSKIVRLGNFNTYHFTPREIDRLPNICLGYGHVHTNGALLKDVRLHSYVNNETMGALDNYAAHENLNIYIMPLENDMFDDLAVSVYKGGKTEAVSHFPIKIKDGKEGVREFFKELYTKIENVNKTVKPEIPAAELSKQNDFMTGIQKLWEKYDNWRIEKVRNFVETTGLNSSVKDILKNIF